MEAIDGDAAAAMHRLSDSSDPVPGAVLQSLAEAITQTIDGEFVGTLNGESEPWIVIRAIDSSAFDVMTDDDEVLSKLRVRFAQVVDIEEA
ncbi:MAG: hypothetical protein AAFX85_06435 [Pseudomonadota bacterium]